MSVTKNPIKSAAISFACLSSLFLVAVFSVDVDDKLRFLCLGILYSMFLTYFAFGAVLLPKKGRRLLRYLLLALTAAMSVLLAVVYYYAVRANSPFDILGSIGPGYVEILLLYPTLAVMIIAPAFGWIGYFRKGE